MKNSYIPRQIAPNICIALTLIYNGYSHERGPKVLTSINQQLVNLIVRNPSKTHKSKLTVYRVQNIEITAINESHQDRSGNRLQSRRGTHLSGSFLVSSDGLLYEIFDQYLTTSARDDNSGRTKTNGYFHRAAIASPTLVSGRTAVNGTTTIKRTERQPSSHRDGNVRSVVDNASRE